MRYIERTADGNSEHAPLLVLMHGRDAFAETIFSVEHLLPRSFRIVSLQAPYKSPREGFEWFKPYDYDHPIESFSEEHFGESIDLATQSIHDLAAHARELFLLGFSQGAAMCYFLGLRGELHPKAVVPMSGFFPRPIEQWTSIDTSSQFLVTHGTDDKILPVTESLYGVDFLHRQNITAEYYEYKGRHKMTIPLLKHVSQWLEARAAL